METGNAAFAPLYSFVAEQVVLSADARRLDALPPPGREAVMGLVASFLPYYATKQVGSPAQRRERWGGRWRASACRGGRYGRACWSHAAW